MSETTRPTAPAAVGGVAASSEEVVGWRSAVRSRPVEVGLTAILLLLSCVYLARYLHAMARTPLLNDELFTVLGFSSRGPGTVLTNYSNPNNAIFLNLLNSILPAAHSLDPMRERMWSMLAVLAMLLLGLYEFFRRRWYLPGALLFFAFAVNFNWLDEALQDRGYGVLGFCAMATSLWLWRYLESREDRWLAGIVIVTLIGVWTVPSFVFFAGPMWLLLLVALRTRRVLWFGLAALAAIVLVYAPVAGDLWHQFTHYSNSFGREYGTLSAPFSTFWAYLFGHHHVQGQHQSLAPLRDQSYVVAAVWLVAFIAPFLVVLPAADRAPAWLSSYVRPVEVTVAHPIRQLVRILAGASAAVLVIALIVQTPPQRTVAFVTVPVAVATIVSLAVLYEDRFAGTAVRRSSRSRPSWPASRRRSPSPRSRTAPVPRRYHPWTLGCPPSPSTVFACPRSPTDRSRRASPSRLGTRRPRRSRFARFRGRALRCSPSSWRCALAPLPRSWSYGSPRPAGSRRRCPRPR